MHVCQIYSYISRKLHTLMFHAITCITCSSASQFLKDFGFSSGKFGSPELGLLLTSVELVQEETVFFFEN